MSASAAYRLRWAALGLCTNCGSRPHAFLSARCQTCIDTQAASGRRNYNRRRVAALLHTRDLLNFKRSPKPPATNAAKQQ